MGRNYTDGPFETKRNGKPQQVEVKHHVPATSPSEPPGLVRLRNPPSPLVLMSEAYLQGLSIGMSSLGGSDSWMRFTLDPTLSDEVGGGWFKPDQTERCRMLCALRLFHTVKLDCR